VEWPILKFSVLHRLVGGLLNTLAGLFLASGGDIFKLSKILGHSSVAITQEVYAHLHPDAYAEDYSRVAFSMPREAGVVLKRRP
jgi:site-specific recombinase XerC